MIAGERRWRAAKLAGLKDVPAYVREADDKQVLELALLENLQRENLNAIEIGLGYQRLMDECAMTQEEVATRMGMDRSTVSNYIRMLKLPPDIIVAVRNGSLSMGHARALINAGEVENKCLFSIPSSPKNYLSDKLKTLSNSFTNLRKRKNIRPHLKTTSTISSNKLLHSWEPK